ncbi:metal ABC transporter solute-binding protein, Zn/Mn family [Vreelandella zhaodongensis]|uniref:Zinc ABC transporter substrate-binding protein n=1 Tax=Vreelandella zhaodongensis TaxID=1176240 RepID=A0ABX2SS13_VREZH|nr:zinc ABC transporter substrate-binding protein [Halomonas zhaodongensis]NYS44673.1 zinc ABC transporter substrate-binding protein [Halomonas zhaodongensis]
MDKHPPWIITLLLVATVNSTPAMSDSSFNVIASFSVIEDLVERVAGDTIRVNTIVPADKDVHRWELTPPNVLAVEEADIVFYNGYGLEPWMRHVEAMSDDTLTLIALAENADYAPLPISTGQYKDNPDPHMWMDPKGAAAYIDVIAHTLSQHYPEKAEAFNTRAAKARDALAMLDQQLKERLDGIPQTNRVLYTSEAGMAYFARAYNFEYAAIWGVNHETLGSAHAMETMSKRLIEKRPPALFHESTAPSIHMDALARDAELTLSGPLYVDALSASDGPAYNYPAMLQHNANLLHEALGGAREE